MAVASVYLVVGLKSAGQEGRMSRKFRRARAHWNLWGRVDLYTDPSLMTRFQSWLCWGLEEKLAPLPVLNTSWPGNWMSWWRGPVGAAINEVDLSLSQQGAPAHRWWHCVWVVPESGALHWPSEWETDVTVATLLPSAFYQKSLISQGLRDYVGKAVLGDVHWAQLSRASS